MRDRVVFGGNRQDTKKARRGESDLQKYMPPNDGTRNSRPQLPQMHATIYIWWEEVKKLYEGTVKNFDKKNFPGWYYIKYVDNDERWEYLPIIDWYDKEPNVTVRPPLVPKVTLRLLKPQEEKDIEHPGDNDYRTVEHAPPQHTPNERESALNLLGFSQDDFVFPDDGLTPRAHGA